MKKFVLNRATFVRKHLLIHDRDIHKHWAMNLVLAALVHPCFLGSEGNKRWLNNDDVATLVGDRISEDMIVRIIEYYEGEYEVSAQGISPATRSMRQV